MRLSSISSPLSSHATGYLIFSQLLSTGCNQALQTLGDLQSLTLLYKY